MRKPWILILQYENTVGKVSDSTFQLTFKKLPLVQFWCHIKEEYPQFSAKAIKSYYSSHSQQPLCVRPDFPHSLQIKQHISRDRTLKQLWESSCLLLNQTLRDCQKCKTMPLLSTLFWKIAIFFLKMSFVVSVMGLLLY